MSDECLQVVEIHGEPGPRNCRQPVKRDGYCARHHPDAVEERLQSDFNHKLERMTSDRIESESIMVGALLRETDPAMFQELLVKASINWARPSDVRMRRYGR